jgi:catechol 2,3-dioxygenase-like lactoylglutathione lyase family enzyme
MSEHQLGFLNIKALALPVTNLERANAFYGETLGLKEAFLGSDEAGWEKAGWQVGSTVILLKENWYAPPTELPNPRVTIETENALEVQKELRSRGVVIADVVERYDYSYVGSFLDSEGNKLWFCSLAKD